MTDSFAGGLPRGREVGCREGEGCAQGRVDGDVELGTGFGCRAVFGCERVGEVGLRRCQVLSGGSDGVFGVGFGRVRHEPVGIIGLVGVAVESVEGDAVLGLAPVDSSKRA